jgi:uncharacterized Zn-finger protein
MLPVAAASHGYSRDFTKIVIPGGVALVCLSGGSRYGPARRDRIRESAMADLIVPHFHNDAGASVIEIGAREFMCVGALPPFDHPHVFLDMGADNEIICPYCSTLYRHDPELSPREARPPECVLAKLETA